MELHAVGFQHGKYKIRESQGQIRIQPERGPLCIVPQTEGTLIFITQETLFPGGEGVTENS